MARANSCLTDFQFFNCFVPEKKTVASLCVEGDVLAPFSNILGLILIDSNHPKETYLFFLSFFPVAFPPAKSPQLKNRNLRRIIGE